MTKNRLLMLMIALLILAPTSVLFAQGAAGSSSLTAPTSPLFAWKDPGRPSLAAPASPRFNREETGTSSLAAPTSPRFNRGESGISSLVLTPPRFAQGDTGTPSPPAPLSGSLNTFTSGSRFLARVRTDSLNVHRFPSEDAERIASLFKGDIVQVVARSLDGSWFEVRRIGRMNNLGWVDNTLIEWDFLPETLVLGDTQTNVIGPVPLSTPPAIGLYLLQAPILRELPLRDGRRIMALPALIVVPVIARNRDTTWLQVNYFGYQGWINRSSIRERSDVDLNTLPVPAGIPEPDTVPVIVIPIEIQQAQIDRLRVYLVAHREMAAGLEAFWWGVYRGQIMPCNAPAEITDYLSNDEDIRELPELARYLPRLSTAVDYLSTARQPLLRCGIIGPSTAVDARNSAINARVIFEATLGTLDNLEQTLHETH